ncbi:MAG: OsmC family protein [Sulfuriferula sp.]
MMNFPYQYQASATANQTGEVILHSEGLADIASAAPKDFGGPGDRWSPENLLVAALGDCYILTFRAIMAAMKINWVAISCDVQGTLARVEGKTKFTEFMLRIQLKVPSGTDDSSANMALQKAKSGCFISNSLSAQINFETDIVVLPEM